MNTHKIPTERKLQLVRTIREENKSNRLNLRTREHILYGRPVDMTLYGAQEETVEETPISTFKLRIVLAVCIFAAYFALDMAGGTVFGKSAGEVYRMLEEDYQSNVFDFISNITYTLDNTPEEEKAAETALPSLPGK